MTREPWQLINQRKIGRGISSIIWGSPCFQTSNRKSFSFGQNIWERQSPFQITISLASLDQNPSFSSITTEINYASRCVLCLEDSQVCTFLFCLHWNLKKKSNKKIARTLSSSAMKCCSFSSLDYCAWVRSQPPICSKGTEEDASQFSFYLQKQDYLTWLHRISWAGQCLKYIRFIHSRIVQADWGSFNNYENYLFLS